MMKDIKNCLKLLKQGYQIKTNIACAVLFAVIGIVFIGFAGYHTLPMCVTYLLLSVLFVVQSLYVMLYSGFVAASPLRRKVEFCYINIINIVGGMVVSVIVLLLAYLGKPGQLDETSIEALLVISGFAGLVIYCYMSLSYKKMVLGIILFVIAFNVIMNSATSQIGVILTNALEGKKVLAAMIFLIEMALGIVLAYGIRKLLYRHDMAKMAAGQKLRMDMV